MMKRNVDLIADLEANHAEVLNEMRTCATRLSILARLSVVTAGALAELHGRKSSTLLCRVLQLENPPKSKTTKGGKRRG